VSKFAQAYRYKLMNFLCE